MVGTSELTAGGTRRLSPVQWDRDGCDGLCILVGDGVPRAHENMVRKALIRGAAVCQKADQLSQSINQRLWAIGYEANVQSKPIDRLVVIEVSQSH
jgi:hypothetical protein